MIVEVVKARTGNNRIEILNGALGHALMGGTIKVNDAIRESKFASARFCGKGNEMMDEWEERMEVMSSISTTFEP
jgi:hypothetical protein